MGLGVKYYLRNLPIFHRRAIVIPSSVGELESYSAGTTTGTVHTNFAQSLCSVVRIQALEGNLF